MEYNGQQFRIGYEIRGTVARIARIFAGQSFSAKHEMGEVCEKEATPISHTTEDPF